MLFYSETCNEVSLPPPNHELRPLRLDEAKMAFLQTSPETRLIPDIEDQENA